MSQLSNELLFAIDADAEAVGHKADLALPHARDFAILTCMDAPFDPAEFAGLAEADGRAVVGVTPGGAAL